MRLPMKCGVRVLCSEISPHNTINVRFNRRIKLPIDVTCGMSLPGQYYAKKGELRQNGIYLPPGPLRLNFFTNYCWYIELKIISLSKTQNYRNPFPTVRKLFTILSAVFAAALFLPEAYASSVNENERADSTAVVREDSVFIFRFKNRTNMFFMHFGGNEDVIRRAAEMIDRNRREAICIWPFTDIALRSFRSIRIWLWRAIAATRSNPTILPITGSGRITTAPITTLSPTTETKMW